MVCKIINGHMFVGDVGEVPCGSKVGAIAVLCGMLRRVSQLEITLSLTPSYCTNSWLKSKQSISYSKVIIKLTLDAGARDSSRHHQH